MRHKDFYIIQIRKIFKTSEERPGKFSCKIRKTIVKSTEIEKTFSNEIRGKSGNLHIEATNFGYSRIAHKKKFAYIFYSNIFQISSIITLSWVESFWRIIQKN